jgi:hypothetical protein
MYRIRLTSGEERTLDGIEALTAAVRDGVVTAECAIYHQRADQWLSIAKHPHFERAVAAVAATPGPAPSTPTPAPAGPNPAEPADLDRTLELLDLLPDPTPNCGEEIEIEPVHLEAPIPDAALLATEPSATLDGLVETSIPPLEPIVEPAPTPASGPVAAAAPPVRQPRTRELDFVYVPETPLPPRTQPAPAPTPKPKPNAELKVAPAPTPTPAPTPAPAPVAALAGEQAAEPVATPAPAPVDMREPAREPAPPSASTTREPDPVAHDDFDGFAAAAEEPAELADDFVSGPARTSGQRPAPTVDFSPLTERQGGRRPAVLAGLAVVALGAVLVVVKPWGSPTDAAAATAPAPVPAAAPAEAAPTAVTTSGAATRSEPSAVPSGFGASDSSPRTARKESRAAEAAPSPDSARPFVPARPAVAAIELGALPASVTAGPGASVPVSRAALARNYAAAYEAARAELQGRFADAGFRGLFDRSRLGSTSSMLDARKAVAEARSALKQYRAREAAIEQAYGDTLQLVGRKLALSGSDLAAWDVRGQRKESAEAAREAEQMLAQLDRVYGLLIAEDGHYRMSGDALAFADSSVAERYAELRGWIQQRRGGDSPSMREIVRAIGSAGLPEGRAP